MPSHSLMVNSSRRIVEVRDPAEPLLYVLRNQLRLTGAKYGCGLGQCGACTVIVDGEAVRSCQLPLRRRPSASDRDDRGTWARRQAASAAGGVHRPSRRPNAAIASPAW